MASDSTHARANDYVDELKNLTDDLLFLDHPGRLREAANRLHSLFSNFGGRDGSENSQDSQVIVLPTGTAICPTDAGRCILDFARTSKFLRGVHQAILSAQEKFPHQPIEVLYAGCGPFAPLAIPLVTRFGPDHLQFTLLDIHGRSIESVRRIIHRLGFDAYVRDYVQADAATYVYQPQAALHIAIIETMQKALEKEPQVANTANISPQLCPGGILIPEKISVDACLVDTSKEFSVLPAEIDETKEFETERVRIKLGRLLELTSQNATDSLPPVTVNIPGELDRKLELMLVTTVNVFDSMVLGEYESAITYPVPVREFDQNDFGTQIGFQYSIGSKPGFRFSRMKLA